MKASSRGSPVRTASRAAIVTGRAVAGVAVLARAALPTTADAGNAPQPDVGELPAFLTAGPTPTAAE